MSDKPESIPYITPELDINVAFWAIDKADATKITSVNLNSNLKLFEFHSTRSLIVCADRDSRITIWDYSLKKVITNIYLFDIFSNSHSSSSSSSSSDNVNDSVGVNATLFIRHRMARDSNQSYRKDKLRTVLQESKQHHKGIEESTHKKTAIDSIKQISFVDRNSIQFNTGDTNTIPLQRTFNSSNMIMIVSDIVTFYDYLSHNSRFLGVNELGKRSSAADFISYNICAIGGVDGNLRLWDCHSWSSVKLITIPIKGEIAVVKTIPVQSSTISTARFRLLVICSDGTSLIWNGSVNRDDSSVIIESTPSAKLRDNLAGSIGRNSIHFDGESGTLLTCTGEKKIRYWDIAAMDSSSRRLSSQLKVTTPSKRSVNRRSSLANFMGGGNNDFFADAQIISFISSHKPDAKFPVSVGKICSFSLLKSSYFPVGSFAVCCKTNSIGICQTTESTGNEEEESEKSSVVSIGNEKSLRFQLLYEITLQSIMSRYRKMHITEPMSLFTDQAMDPGNKVYLVRCHPTQPNLLALSTSVGLIIVSLPHLMSDTQVGTHCRWGRNILIASDSTIKRISVDTLAKNIAEDEEFSNKPDDKTGKLLLVDVHTDTLEEISINAKDKNDLAGRPSSLNKNPSLMKKSFAGSPAPAIVQMRNACRPSFIPSPSGNYCAVFWADTLKYTVYNTFSSDSTTTFSLDNSQKKRLNVIDSGICLSFAWYNNRDQFVIIKPPYMSSVSENKKKGMVKSMLFGGTKDFIQFEKTAIVMKQLQNEVCINMQLDLSSHLLQKELISAEQINDIFSGFLIGINFTLKSETTEKATTDISDLLTANLKSSEVIAHNSEQERLANDWRNRSKTSSDSYFRFFCLLTKSELSQLLEVEHSKNDPRRGKGKTKKTTTEDHAKDVQERGSDELVYSLAVVGPIMRSVSAVSWDYAYGFCSVLIGGTVNIMKLYVTTDEDTKPIGSFSYSSDSKVVSSTTLVLKTLATVELSLPIPTHIGVSSMFWDHKTLFAVTATGVSIINLVNTKLNDVNEPIANVANLSFSSQYRGWQCGVSSAGDAVAAQSVLIASAAMEVCSVHSGSVFFTKRDCSICSLPIISHPTAALIYLASLYFNFADNFEVNGEEDKDFFIPKRGDTGSHMSIENGHKVLLEILQWLKRLGPVQLHAVATSMVNRGLLGELQTMDRISPEIVIEIERRLKYGK